MDPALVAVEVGADPAPLAGGSSTTAGLAQHQLGHLLGAHRGLGEDGSDGGAGDERLDIWRCRTQVAAARCLRRAASQSRQSVTPRKVQIRQMKVPQLVQGYPSDARSSRPQARHPMASCSWISATAVTQAMML